jgi:hypothetical protein
MDKRTFTENTVTSAYEDRCCQALATAIAAKARGSSIVRGGRDASVTAHKTARHDAGYERFFVKDEVKDISFAFLLVSTVLCIQNLNWKL